MSKPEFEYDPKLVYDGWRRDQALAYWLSLGEPEEPLPDAEEAQ